MYNYRVADNTTAALMMGSQGHTRIPEVALFEHYSGFGQGR
jgi:hypothetical protein